MPANIINHVVLVLDASSSMTPYRAALVQVADNQIKHLARRSQELDQETRVTVYSFSNPTSIECLIFDKDVLRMPSIASLYKVYGNTALLDATGLALEDLGKTAQMYGDHAFLVYVLTDGEENASRKWNQYSLKSKIDSLPENWTVGIFVPSPRSIFEAKRCGFHSDSIAVWNPSDSGVSEVGETIRRSTEQFMTNRSVGIRGTKSLFKVNTVTGSQIVNNLTPMSAANYSLIYVPVDQRVDEFVYDHTGAKLIIGKAYYQLTKKETIQPQKNIAIQYNNKIYTGPAARQLLGLPDHTVDVDPGNDSYKDYRIFVQSTALNRKLIGGTSLLLMR